MNKKVIKLTESDLLRIVKKVISEQMVKEEDLTVRDSNTKLKTMPTINFNLLPQSAYNTGVFVDKLHKAGWPKEMNNPVTDDKTNFDRYYTISSYSEQGLPMYTKKPKAPNPQYILDMPLDKGFDKFPCIKKYYEKYYRGIDSNFDGIVDRISDNQTQKIYFPDGSVTLLQGGSKTIKSTYYCSGNKVIDRFTKNPKSKVYSNNDPWVKEPTGGKNSKGEGNHDYIPWYTKDPEGSKWISNLQQFLIDKKYLNIKAPTGFAGNMTKNAVLSIAPGDEFTNSTNGIRRQFYNSLLKIK